MHEKSWTSLVTEVIKSGDIETLDTFNGLIGCIKSNCASENQWQDSLEDVMAIIDDKSVSCILAAYLERFNAEGSSEIPLHVLIRVLCALFPLIGWFDVFVGLEVHLEKMVSCNTPQAIWSSLLLAWQNAIFWDCCMGESGLSDALKPHEVAEAFSQIPALSAAVLPPLEMIPENALEQFVKFCLRFDLANNSKLCASAVFTLLPSGAQVSFADILFQKENFNDCHALGLSFDGYLAERLHPGNASCRLWALKLGVRLQIILRDKNPVGAEHSVRYIEGLLDFYETYEAKSNPLVNDARIRAMFENLRCACVKLHPADTLSIANRTFLRSTATTSAENSAVKASEVSSGTVYPVLSEESGDFRDGHPNAGFESDDTPVKRIDDEREGEEYGDRIYAAFYRGEMTEIQLVNFLAELESKPDDSADYHLFSRMIRSLFIECRHFNQYPQLELCLTGDLMGAILKRELLKQKPDLQMLGMRCINEALLKPETTNIFKFGLVALQGFLPIVYSCPVLVKQLLCNTNLCNLFPRLRGHLEIIARLIPQAVADVPLVDSATLRQLILPDTFPSADSILVIPPHLFLANTQYYKNSSVAVPAPVVSKPQPVELSASATTADIERLLAKSELGRVVIVPPPDVVSGVSAVLNSLVPAGVANASRRIDELITPSYAHWFAYMLVVRRVLTEQNLHKLYSQLITGCSLLVLSDMVTNVAYDALNFLLRYIATGKTNSAYIRALKCLGNWIGLMTLGRNKPLKSKCLDIEKILFNSYEQKTLDAVLPFVCATLSTQQYSRVFRKVNVWNSQLYILLASLLLQKDLSSPSTLEIEMLFDALGLDLAEYLSIAKSRPSLFGNPEPEDSPARTPHRSQLLNALVANAVINPALALFQKYPDLKIAVPIAMERAIKELIAALGDKAAHLAAQTTLAIVTKDFALEAQDAVVSRAANLMVAVLASSIVAVTGRSSLRDVISKNFRYLIKSSANMSNECASDRSVEAAIDQAAVVLGNENLHMTATLIEHVVVEQAILAVQDGLAESLARRRQALASGEKFIDTNVYSSRYPAALPAPLRLTGKLTPAQLEVYRAFNELSSLGRPPVASPRPEPHQDSAGLQVPLAAIGEAVTRMKLEVQKLVIGNSTIANPLHFIRELPNDHPISSEILAVLDTVRNSDYKDTVALCTARRLLRSIYDAGQQGAGFAVDGRVGTSHLYLECFMIMLASISEHSLVHNLKDVVTIWLISAIYLKPGTQPARDQTLDFRSLTPDVGARTLIVLWSATAYQLIDIRLLETDCLLKLIQQIENALVEPGKLSPAAMEGASVALELTIHIIHTLVIELKIVDISSMKGSILALAGLVQHLRASRYSEILKTSARYTFYLRSFSPETMGVMSVGDFYECLHTSLQRERFNAKQ